METSAINTALTSLATEATSTITGAAPIVLGVMGTIAGIEIGFRLFKKLKKHFG